jgi:DNA-binding NarL/FixJ family response regulator
LVLVDDHAMVRRGLEQLLTGEAGIDVVGTASTGAQAVEVVAQHLPDVVLMDLQMPEMDGASATRTLRDRFPDVQVLVLTSFSDRERIVAALDAGAVGYLLKDAEPEELVAGIEAVARGESPLHPRAARELLSARTRAASGVGDVGVGAAEVRLTPRELEVLTLVRQGLANKQIGRRLGISERTVKAHLTSLYQRLGVADRTQAALWAERHGVG